jgi:D-aspartate ligase
LSGAVIIGGHIHGLAIARSLGRAGINVHILDRYRSLARYSKYCASYSQCPDYSSDQFVPFLIRYAKTNFSEPLTLFLSDDFAIGIVAQHKKMLSEFYRIIYPDKKKFDLLFRKKQFLKFALSEQLPLPKTWLNAERADDISEYDFPLLIKGDDSLLFWQLTKVKAMKVHDKKELETALQKLAAQKLDGDIFLQECLPVHQNPVLSFTAFCIDGEIKSWWIGEKTVEHPHPFGIAILAQSIKKEELFSPSQILLRKLAYTGICEIEFLYDPKKDAYKILEMNARSWLWLQCAIVSGVNYPLYVHNFLNKKKQQYTQQYEKSVFWINVWHYILTAPIKLAQKEYSISQLRDVMTSKKAYAIFDRKDLKPFLMYSLKLPYYVNHI